MELRTEPWPWTSRMLRGTLAIVVIPRIYYYMSPETRSLWNASTIFHVWVWYGPKECPYYE